MNPIEYDTLPDRFMNESSADKKAFSSREEFDFLIQKYYSIRGLDKLGNVKRETLQFLGLENLFS